MTDYLTATRGRSRPVLRPNLLGGAVVGATELAPTAPSQAPTTKSIPLLPNAITLAGLACTCIWLAGGSPWFAIAGLVADELDGRVARATGQTSEFGSLFDWATDLTLTGAVAVRVGGPALAMLPPLTIGQVMLRDAGWRPPLGSARAVLTLWALGKEGFFSKRP